MSKAKGKPEERRRLHEGINALTRDEVRRCLLAAQPGLKGEELDEACRRAVAGAHRLVSPAKKRVAPQDKTQDMEGRERVRNTGKEAAEQG